MTASYQNPLYCNQGKDNASDHHVTQKTQEKAEGNRRQGAEAVYAMAQGHSPRCVRLCLSSPQWRQAGQDHCRKAESPGRKTGRSRCVLYVAPWRLSRAGGLVQGHPAQQCRRQQRAEGVGVPFIQAGLQGGNLQGVVSHQEDIHRLPEPAGRTSESAANNPRGHFRLSYRRLRVLSRAAAYAVTKQREWQAGNYS